MAALVLGTAGAVVGGIFGGPVGAAIGQLVGTAIGNLIDPPKVEGPRLDDLKLQRSTYGAVIPILYGAENRIAGNVIWQTDLVEHKQKSGGKGGPQVTTYTYSASWAVLLCAGEIIGISKMWADGRLISTTGEPTEDLPFVLYLGDETQLPDPTIEAEEGAGEVPAHRGYAYLVFTDVFLTDHGNRIFQLEAEVTASGAAKLVNVSTFTPQGPEDTWIGVQNPYIMGAVLDGGQLIQYCWEDADFEIRYFEKRWNAQTGAVIDQTVPIAAVVAGHTLVVGQNSNIAAVRYAAPALQAYWWQGPGEVAPIGTPGTMLNPSANYYVIASRPLVLGDFVYAPSGAPASSEARIGKWGFVDGRPHPTAEVEYFDINANSSAAPVNAEQISLSYDDEGYLWATSPLGGSTAELWKIDPATMTLIRHWPLISGTLGAALTGSSTSSSFTVFRGMLAVIDAATQPGNARLYFIEPASDTFTLLDSLSSAWTSTIPGAFNLGGGYFLTESGIIRISALETLDNIVADISERCGLTSSQYDVTDLTDGVRGYRIAAQMTGKNAIEALRQAYFFDGAEVDDLVYFVHRDRSPIDEIPDDELGAHESGGTLPPLLEVSRVPDAELPRKIDVVYINPDADYQPGAQYAARQTSHSELDVSLSWPITFNDDEARERANAILFSAWIEREPARFWTSRKWEALVPTDVVTVQGRDLRIVDKRSTVAGVIEFRGVPSRPIVFTQVTAGGVGGGFAPQTTSTLRPETTAVLLDIPNIYQTDPPFGFRAAMTPSGPGSWTGATLYKSYDNTNYVAVASTDTPEAVGHTVVTGSPTTSGTASVGATLGVTLINDLVELESCTATDLAQGRNLFAVRRSDGFWNLMQFQYATLISTNTYELSGIVQSPLDDTSVALHATGDEFVLLPVITVDAPESDLNVAIYYKAVSFGKTLGSTPYQIFTNTGIASGTYHETVANNLREFSCSFGSPVGSPAIGKTGLVPAPTEEDCNLDRILSVHGWIDNTSGSGVGSPSVTGTSTIEVDDEGAIVVAAADQLDFAGNGVTVTAGVGNKAVITIPGSIHTLSHGAEVDTDATVLNFNAPLYAQDAGAGVTNVLSAVFQGADTGSPSPHAGEAGDVPAPASGDAVANKFLKADGTWETPVLSVTTLNVDLARPILTVRMPRWVYATGFSSATQSSQGVSFAGSGFAAGPAWANTFIGQTPYLRMTSTTAQNNVWCMRSFPNGLNMARGNAATLGGWYVRFNICLESVAVTSKVAIGLMIQANLDMTAGSVPSSQTDCAFFGFDNGDANWSFMNNDNAGTCTKTSMGFAAQTINKVYSLEIWCAGNGGNVFYQMIDQSNTGSPVNGSVSTNLPTSTSSLVLFMYMQGNTAAVASAQTIVGLYDAYVELSPTFSV